MTETEFKNALIERHGRAVYEKLINSSAVICGLGGLGSNTACALARAGIGRLKLIDFDRVDITNLNRQNYFISDIGRYKTEAQRDIIRSINPVIELETATVMMDEKNSAELTNGYDVVCECFDKAENKAMLINTVLSETDRVIVSGSGMAGHFSSNSIVTKKAMNRLYICGDGVSGIEDGNVLMAPRVGICAMHQANMVLRILLDKGEV